MFSLNDIRSMHLIVEQLVLMYRQALPRTEVRPAAGFNCRTIGKVRRRLKNYANKGADCRLML